MKLTTTIARRDRDRDRDLPPNALPSKSNASMNKRSSRAFGPVDINTVGVIAGHQPVGLGSPNPTLKKKSKPIVSVSNSPAKNCGLPTASRNPSGAMQLLQKPSRSNPSAVIANPASNASAITVTKLSTQETTAADWRSVQKELDELFVKQSRERMKGVPMIEMPEIFVNNGVQLLEHQVEGIRWLTHKEVTNTDVPPYYKLRNYGPNVKWYFCSLDMKACRNENGPEPLRHSILADDMGLGKTLQSIGLILSNPPAGRNGIKAYPYIMPEQSEEAPPRCTIIVCPVSVMSNWKMEIEKFVHKKKKDILQVEIYQGQSRVKVLRKVQEGKLDILICSYQTLASDLKKYREMQEDENAQTEEISEEKPNKDVDPIIFAQSFHRIILDEAHMIRNAKTLYFQSAKALIATHKLCLTGTPFVNHPRDIHSFLDFLEVAPYNDIDLFNDRVVQPIEERKEVGLARLRVVMGAIAIRRTKKEVDHSIKLPEKEVQIRKIHFPEYCEHKQISEMMYHTCRTAFLALSKGGKKVFGRNACRLFGMVLRVRQSSCDAGLVPAEVREEVASLWEHFRFVDIETLSDAEGISLFEKLVDALATAKSKIERAKEANIKQEEKIDDSIPSSQKSRQTRKIQKRSIPLTTRKKSGFGRSPKVQALMDAIVEMKPDEKGVIFSQWTKFLDIIQHELESEGHSFTRIDGTMNAAERYNAMECFGADGYGTVQNPRFILCSLKACNTGISLTRANHIFVMDTWWNVAEENQAMDRVHRIGQIRPVRVIRFIVKDSIEERFIDVQDAKEALAKGSMERLKKEDRRKANITAFKDLFEMKTRVHVWEGSFVDDDAFDDGSDLHDFIVPDDHFE